MTTLYRNPTLRSGAGALPEEGYTTYREPDTTVPPKAAPVLCEVSVNGAVIAEREILAEAQNHRANNPGEAVRTAAQALVVRELLWQEAQRLGIVATPERDVGGRLETERDAAIRGLVDREVVTPMATAEECRRYYERHPHKFYSEPLYEARHILLVAAQSDREAQQAAFARAQALCESLARDRGAFAAMAREYSDCPSREQGGNLGQLMHGSTVAEFEEALEAMEEGEVSREPVPSPFGFHIISLERKIEGHQLAYNFVAERIAAWLEASAWSKAVSQYISVLAGEADIRGIEMNGAEGPLVKEA